MNKITNNSTYKKVTSIVIDVLERHKNSGGVNSWLSLLNGDILAYNAYTGKEYDWLNQVLLSYYCQIYGYGVNRWMTLNQGEMLGADLISVKEDPYLITFFEYRHFEKNSMNDITALVKSSIRYKLDKSNLEYYTVPDFRTVEVYNVFQFSGLPDKYYDLGPITEVEGFDCESIADEFLKVCGAIIDYKRLDDFIVSGECISVPYKRIFTDNIPFHKKAYCAIARWGRSKALKNKTIVNNSAFELLINELFAAYLAATHGYCMPISSNPQFLDLLIKSLKEDNTLFVMGSAYARKILKVIKRANRCLMDTKQLEYSFN